MVAFDFITDDQFRTSLESDYRELNAAIESKSWKSTHVLAGSIVEAVLVDYLVAINYRDPGNRDVLELGLAQVISACKSEGLLTQRAEDLSNVVRGYRNLVHPGRVKRLGETVDEEGATVAKALVDLIVRAVAKKRDAVYGPTAEQIIARLESDSSRIAFLGPMLEKMRPTERRRLLLDVLPQHYFGREMEHWDRYTSFDMESGRFQDLDQSALEKAFRFAFDAASDEIKREVVSKFVWILENEAEIKRANYEGAFFKVTDLQYASEAQIEIVKAHIFVVLSTNPRQIVNSLYGIGKLLTTTDETIKLVDGIIASRTHSNTQQIVEHIEGELPNVPPALRDDFLQQVRSWIASLRGSKYDVGFAEQLALAVGIDIDNGNSEVATGDELDDEIPF